MNVVWPLFKYTKCVNSENRPIASSYRYFVIGLTNCALCHFGRPETVRFD